MINGNPNVFQQFRSLPIHSAGLSWESGSGNDCAGRVFSVDLGLGSLGNYGIAGADVPSEAFNISNSVRFDVATATIKT